MPLMRIVDRDAMQDFLVKIIDKCHPDTVMEYDYSTGSYLVFARDNVLGVFRFPDITEEGFQWNDEERTNSLIKEIVDFSNQYSGDGENTSGNKKES